MAGEVIRTAPCRFCGQMVQIEYGYELTAPQAEEEGEGRHNKSAPVKAGFLQDDAAGGQETALLQKGVDP